MSRAGVAWGRGRARLRATAEAAGRVCARWARTRIFRLAVAAACLAVHLAVLVHSASDRFGARWNAAPGQPPAFANPAANAGALLRWDRLMVSRWDSGSYVSFGLRTYEHCPPRGLPIAAYNVSACNLAFYPTYGLLGRALSRVSRLPIDYALFAISIASSLAFLFLWTGPALVERIGLGETYLSLLLLNVFTTGFTLVTVLTEPLTLALTLGAFVALFRRRFLLAALLAGAASGLRITGIAAGGAMGLALLVEAWTTRPPTRVAWARRLGEVVLCGWGQLGIMIWHYARFGDARAYLHMHALQFKHEVKLANLEHPRPEWLIRSMENPLHEGVWLVLALLWFLLGHAEALRRFPAHERVFWYGLFAGTVGISAVGMLPISWLGMNRYLLLALPLFLAMANLMRRRPALLVFWVLVSGWHYWQVDLCTFTGGPGNRTLTTCHTPHWIGRL